MLCFKPLPHSNILEMTVVRKTAAKTVTTFWYFDILCWLKSSTGEKFEKPLEVMTQEQIDWVKKHGLSEAPMTARREFFGASLVSQ